jgi:hypothetical protein
MLESLSPAICNEFEIIRRQEFPEALKFLPSLFDLLIRDRVSEMYMCDLEAKIQEKQAREENEKQKAIEWIREKAEKLMTHPLHNHFLVKPAIQRLSRTLNLEEIRWGQSYISSLMKDLKQVSCLLASFGNHEMFEDWAPIEIRTDQIVLYDLSLPFTDKTTKINLNSPIGKQLIKSRKQGFINATIIPISSQPGIQKSPIEMEYGWIEKFEVSELVKRSHEYDNSWNVTVQMATLKSDPILLYEHLKLLSQNWRVKSPALSLEKSLVQWQEIDMVNTKMRNWFYLCTPQSEKKEPLDHKKIVDLVETFLLMAVRFCLKYDLDQKEAKPKRNIRNPDEFQVQSFILKQRRANPDLSREAMVDKIIRAIGVDLNLKHKYKRSTYIRWDRKTDPIKDLKEKLSRTKSKNI